MKNILVTGTVTIPDNGMSQTLSLEQHNDGVLSL